MKVLYSLEFMSRNRVNPQKLSVRLPGPGLESAFIIGCHVKGKHTLCKIQRPLMLKHVVNIVTFC
jgi:hypothetical protein